MITHCSKVFGLRHLNVLYRNLLKYQFNAYRQINQSKQQYQGQTHNYRQNQKRDFANKKLFRHQQKNYKKFNEKITRTNDDSQTNVEEYVKTINQINKEFLGIKLNTNYFKVYNQKKFEEIIQPDRNQSYKIHDLPFNLKSKSDQTDNISQQTTQLSNNLATKMLKNMTSQEKLVKEFQVLVKSYFKDLLSRQRNCRMEPNFQVYSRKVVQTLKAHKKSIKLVDNEVTPKIVLKNVNIFKGVKVNRNDNYSLDSYQVNFEEEKENILTYTLWKKQRQEYPEDQWLAQKFILARIEAEVSNAPVVEVSEEGSVLGSNKGQTHSFVFEVDLTVPPSLSELSLSAQQFLNSYRLKTSNIQITNVDNKNIFFNLAFKQEDKKHRLINKII